VARERLNMEGLDAGFRLARLEEPRPSEDYCQAHPSQRGWRDHAGLFLHVRATKPAGHRSEMSEEAIR
jgi:hypothetical protein